MKHFVIKANDKTEEYSSTKLSRSISSTLHALRLEPDVINEITIKVIQEFESWLKPKHEITSKDIRQQVSSYLKKYNKDAFVIYKNHGVL